MTAALSGLVAELRSHLPELDALPVHGTLQLTDGIVRAIQRDRNCVFHIVLNDESEYFLKLLESRGGDAARRSAIGRGAAQLALRGEPGAMVPAASLELGEGVELVARIPGVSLNRYLYGRFLADGIGHFRATFEALGRSLAILHQTLPSPHEQMPTDRRVEQRVLHAVERGEIPAPLNGAGAVAAELAAAPAEHFVHANLAFTNILCRRGWVGLIDFENSGTGHGADDLARLLQHLYCLELASPVWRLLSAPAATELLRGYRAHGSVDPGALAAWLYLHLADYHTTRFVRREESRRVAGLRVPEAKLLAGLQDGPRGVQSWLASRGAA